MRGEDRSFRHNPRSSPRIVNDALLKHPRHRQTVYCCSVRRASAAHATRVGGAVDRLIRMALVHVLLLSVSAGSAVASELRQTINFNREWLFQLSDTSGAESRDFDDAPWDRVGLPHSFSLPYFASEKFYVGYGWYRKCFDVPESWRGGVSASSSTASSRSRRCS